MSLTLNIIGAGKLGTTIARIINCFEAANILGICNQHMESAQTAVQRIGAGTAYATLNELPPAQLYLICTPDDAIADIAKSLHASGRMPHDAVLAHTSGVHNSAILKASGQQTHAIASIHPIRSFSATSERLSSLTGTYCALEGDHDACERLSDLFKSLGAQMFYIDKRHKTIYHAASVMANNYLVTLHAHATQCFAQSGLDLGLSAELVSQLMRGALSNIDAVSHRQALTGPIQRGDVNTVSAHVQALTNHETLTDSAHLYEILGLATLALTTHDVTLIARFTDILQGGSGCYLG